MEKKTRVDEEQYDVARTERLGWCTTCQDFTTADVLPGEVTVSGCAECQTPGVLGALKALRGGFIEVSRAILAVLVLALGLTGCNGCGPGYSDGDRTGVVVKLSHKGMVYKSWEGQLNLGGMKADDDSHMVVNMWEFSVRDEAVVQQIRAAMDAGKRVTLHYSQWLVGPVDIDTDRVITAVRQ